MDTMRTEVADVRVFHSLDEFATTLKAAVNLSPRPSRRILFINHTVLGWSSNADMLLAEARHIEGLSSWHLNLGQCPVADQGAWRLSLPIGLLDRSTRRVHYWNQSLGDVLRQQDPRGEFFDWVHVAPHLLAAGLANSNYGRRTSVGMDATVLQSRGLLEHSSAASVRVRLKRLLQYESEALEQVPLIAAMSKWALEAVLRQHRPDMSVITPPSVHVDPNGPVARRSVHGRPTHVIFIGNAFERKGGLRLLRWFRSTDDPALRLTIVSRDAPEVHDDRITQLRGVPRAHLVERVLPTADVLALPTASDMSPWVLAEAQSRGVPCVAFRVGAVDELVQHGATGLLVPPAAWTSYWEALENVLSDEYLWRSLSEAAWQWARDGLNPTTHFRRWYAAVEEALS
jgi:glycosyltransferase involved in cell wall biosynthesis